MSELCLVGYGSFIDPRNVAGMFRYSSDELVLVNGYQRFLGAVDLTKRDIVIDNEGRLQTREVGVCTIEPSDSHKFVATLYRGVPEEDIAMHDAREMSSHRFSRLTINPRRVSRFDGGSWYVDEKVLAYHADPVTDVKGRQFRIVRDDILPDPSHLEKCRQAAAAHGGDVARAFEETTFLADRQTSLGESQFARA